MDRREKQISLFHIVDAMGKMRILDYQDTMSRQTYSGSLEYEIMSLSYRGLENEYKFRILDVFGEGNCLYYCMLFKLQVRGMHPDPQNIEKRITLRD